MAVRRRTASVLLAKFGPGRDHLPAMQRQDSSDRTRHQVRLACVIPTLRTGGSERVLTGLSGALVERGFEVSLFTFAPPGEAPFYGAPRGVRLLQLDCVPRAAGLGRAAVSLRAAAKLRRALAGLRPDVVLSFTTLAGVVTIFATRGLAVPVVVAERNDPGGHVRRTGRVLAGWRDLAYARAEQLVVQTNRARASLQHMRVPPISVISNPIPGMAAASPAGPAPNGRYRLLAIGRLTAQKGFDILIPAFGAVAQRHPDWDLVILGEGPDRNALEELVRKHRLAEQVIMPGIVHDVERELVKSHLMAFPSRFEGFPNALTEAMATGLPTVAFPEVSGVEELVLPGKTGLLASWSAPVTSLAECLDQLMSSAALRLQLGGAAREHVKGHSAEHHVDRWEALLREVAERRANEPRQGHVPCRA